MGGGSRMGNAAVSRNSDYSHGLFLRGGFWAFLRFWKLGQQNGSRSL